MVTYQADVTYFKFIDPKVTQNTNMFYMRSRVRLQDNSFDIFDLYQEEFDIFEQAGRYDYTQRMPQAIDVAEREYLSIFFRADNELRLYKRARDDIVTYMGDLGGLLDVLVVLGYTLTGIFASKIFKAALIGSAYRIQSYTKEFP